MCRWLKKKPRQQYHKAYDYLRKRIRFLDYCEPNNGRRPKHGRLPLFELEEMGIHQR